MKKPLFTLTRKNQKGQVAIFVALIFQVIFVFFALLVNIGLLVHHKINLQQSTDLAAYYGAMKQAESLNAMAHVNFQIRQAWKLLAWRYRVLGTFGNEKASTGPYPLFPINLMIGGASNSPDLSQPMQGGCTSGANSADTPFFCVGHTGFKYWPAGENGCKINCELLDNAGFSVGAVNNTNPLQPGAGTAQAVYNALGQANTTIAKTCKDLAGANIKVLAQIILAYQADMMTRSKTLNMLAGNLSNDAGQLKDLDGKDVKLGVEKTLKNNLTEANLTGISPTINLYNSLSHPNCAIDKSKPSSKKQTKKEFVKRIEFDFINFFQHSCQWSPTGAQDVNGGNQLFNPGTIFNKTLDGLADGTPLTKPDGTQAFVKGVPAKRLKIDDPSTLPTPLQNEILKLIKNDDERFSVGYEKDPWCPAYFVVQASSTPRIPFLPLVEVKLNAVAIAKPFGGSIGPWFGKKWEASDSTSQAGLSVNDSQKQTDEMLPANNGSGAPPITLKDNTRLLVNFSRFVGDTKGLSDPTYLAEYHGALLNRLPSSGTGLFGSTGTFDPNPQPNTLMQPQEDPTLESWMKTYDLSQPDYDPIVGAMNGKDSYLRALELSAIAPNQFDLTYYSIDPDFYNNYYLKLQANYNVLNASSGNLGPAQKEFIRPDLGYNKNIYSGQPEFSVRNQIEIIKKTFSGFSTGVPNATPGSPVKFIDAFPELVKKQSSLLTGWTFKNFTQFDTFPGGDMNLPDDTMNFARCNDKWQGSPGQPEYQIPKDISSTLPSTPGNCVTGGRVGYSVKLVSPSSLAGPQALGGPGAQKDVIRNPIPTSYLTNFP